MDERVRELERRFEGQPDDATCEQLLQAYARSGARPPASVLLRAPRWRPLVRFVATWYERPLEVGDGCAPAEVDAAEAQLGCRLPAALAEWHLLAGRRLGEVQDRPIPLDGLHLLDGHLSVWCENQGNWTIVVPAGGPDEEPRVRSVGAGPGYEGGLVEALVSMATSDTLVGAWSGDQHGTFGALGPQVRGGRLDELDEEVAEVLPHLLPALPGPGCPAYDAPAFRARGDATTVVRTDLEGVEWMTATDEAHARLAELLHLDDDRGPPSFDLEVRFERLPEALCGRNDPYGALARAGLKPYMSPLYSDACVAQIIIEEPPEEALRRLRQALPAEVVASSLTVTARPRGRGRFQTIWPPAAPAR